MLFSKDENTRLLREKGIHTWADVLVYVRHLPYGRNADRCRPELVILEGKGTCSSKHALLKQIADANGILGVKLLLGIYRMTAINTPGIGAHLANNGLEYLPEAHCYLSINGERMDCTTARSNIDKIAGDILQELEIQPGQVGDFKVKYHKNYLREWQQAHLPHKSFEELWAVRERCIEALSFAS
jgi:hypothetical protein